MRSVVLPFVTDVEMKSYLLSAFSLGAMKASIPNYDVWLCNKLINCNCHSNMRDFWDTQGEDLWDTKEGGTIYRTVSFTPDMHDDNGIDILNCNVEMINCGYYISGQYDEFYIPGTKAYGKVPHNHRFILFGYDNQKKTFKSATYLDTGFYDCFEIKFSDFLSAVSSNAPLQTFNYYSVNKDYKTCVDINLVRMQLIDYLNARNSKDPLPDLVYGIKVWDVLADYVASRRDNNIDLRYTRVSMEHRLIMLKRINTLAELGFITRRDISETYREDVFLPAQRIFNMSMKYNVTHNSDLLSRVADSILSLNRRERVIIEDLVDQIICPTD